MATWTLSYNGQIIETNQTGQFTLGPEYPLGSGYKITYQNGSTSETIEYTRTKECIACDCSDINFTPNSQVNYETSGATVTLGTIAPKETCRSYIGVSGDSNFTSVKIEGNTVKGTFGRFTQTPDNNGRALKYRFTINGKKCDKVYTIYQQAFRGTDNGVDSYVGEGEKSYPIYLIGSKAALSDKCTCKCSTGERCSNGYTTNIGWDDADSIFCADGAYFFDGQNYHKIDSTWDGADVTDWLHVDASCDVISPTETSCDKGYCYVGMIRVSVKGSTDAEREWDPTTKGLPANTPRKARITITSHDFNADPHPTPKNNLSPETGCKPGCPPAEYAGKECALKWYYDVWQLPKGHYICYNQNEGHPETFEIRPLTQSCSDCRKHKGGCECK